MQIFRALPLQLSQMATSHAGHLRLTLVNGAKQFSCYAIVDSGADFCTFPLSFAIQLGLNPLQGRSQPTAGLGSANVPTYFWNLTINLQQLAVFDAYTGFTTGMDAWGLGLLGQDGFFDRFPTQFDLKN